MVAIQFCRLAVLLVVLILLALPLATRCWDSLWKAVLGSLPSVRLVVPETDETLPDEGSDSDPEEPTDEEDEGSELDPDG